MDYSIKNEEEKKEYFDNPEEFDQKVTLLTELIKRSKHFVSFTGAGISTASGIPDYRSGYNTVLETGAGCWETKANKVKYEKDKKIDPKARGKALPVHKTKAMEKAYPSKTHMAMVELMNKGHLKYIVS
jgi:NAD-dependent SIR2 family protein deacetylase